MKQCTPFQRISAQGIAYELAEGKQVQEKLA